MSHFEGLGLILVAYKKNCLCQLCPFYCSGSKTSSTLLLLALSVLLHCQHNCLHFPSISFTDLITFFDGKICSGTTSSKQRLVRSPKVIQISSASSVSVWSYNMTLNEELQTALTLFNIKKAIVTSIYTNFYTETTTIKIITKTK